MLQVSPSALEVAVWGWWHSADLALGGTWVMDTADKGLASNPNLTTE